MLFAIGSCASSFFLYFTHSTIWHFKQNLQVINASKNGYYRDIYRTCINTSMKQLTAFKYRIYPTSEQEILIAKTFGCKRWVHNHLLAVQQDRFKNKLKHLSWVDMNNLITPLKKEVLFLKEVDSIALQNSAIDLAEAYGNFFDSVTGKRKGPKVNPPKFKSKHGRQSYRTRNVKVLDNALFMPKLKEVEAVIHRPIPDDAVITSTTISRNPDGRYYASILTEIEVDIHDFKNREVGCDLGIKDILITSDGLKFKNPNELNHIARTKRLLKLKQKQFARTKKGSKNHEKLRVQVARLYSKITRQRNDYYHNISRYLVDNYDAIHLENLAVSNMLKNRCLSRAIHEAAWSTLNGMIDYKAKWAGVTYTKINRFFPSSKTCSCCGHKLESLDLATREWTCPSCGEIHDRDWNAAINILHEGQRQCYGVQLSSHATGDVGVIPEALLKLATKIERSVDIPQLVMGVGKPDYLQSSGS